MYHIWIHQRKEYQMWGERRGLIKRDQLRPVSLQQMLLIMYRKDLEMVMLRNCHRFNGGSWFRGCSPVKTPPIKSLIRLSQWEPEDEFLGPLSLAREEVGITVKYQILGKRLANHLIYTLNTIPVSLPGKHDVIKETPKFTQKYRVPGSTQIYLRKEQGFWSSMMQDKAYSTDRCSKRIDELEWWVGC